MPPEGDRRRVPDAEVSGGLYEDMHLQLRDMEEVLVREGGGLAAAEGQVTSRPLLPPSGQRFDLFSQVAQLLQSSCDFEASSARLRAENPEIVKAAAVLQSEAPRIKEPRRTPAYDHGLVSASLEPFEEILLTIPTDLSSMIKQHRYSSMPRPEAGEPAGSEPVFGRSRIFNSVPSSSAGVAAEAAAALSPTASALVGDDQQQSMEALGSNDASKLDQWLVDQWLMSGSGSAAGPESSSRSIPAARRLAGVVAQHDPAGVGGRRGTNNGRGIDRERMREVQQPKPAWGRARPTAAAAALSRARHPKGCQRGQQSHTWGQQGGYDSVGGPWEDGLERQLKRDLTELDAVLKRKANGSGLG
jgi:hypothetical protein